MYTSVLGGCGPSLQLGDDVIKPSDHVRLLGMTTAAYVGLDKHFSTFCKHASSGYNESVKTLVHAVVKSRIDYCNSVMSTAQKIMDKLQHVQNSAARVVTGTQKYERGLSRLMHDDLHWLVIPQQVQYKLAMTVHRCLRHGIPRYLADYCVPVSEVAGRQHL